MRTSSMLYLLVLSLLAAIPAAMTAAPPSKAVVALVQAESSPRQDPFMADYDFSQVRPMMQAHLDKLIGLMEEAGERGADIVCGPEDMQHIGGYGLHMDKKDPETGEILFNSLAVTVPGELTDRLAAVARKYRMYVVAPIYEREGGRIYNTTVVFGRDGEIIGKHRKTVLPVMETWGVTPGDSYEVFELDFGNIAVSTCWEITYPEINRIYALQGADIIFHPTMGRENESGKSLSTAHRYLTRAVDDRVFLAPVILGTDGTGIIDFNGEVVAEAVGESNTVVMAEVDLSREPIRGGQWWPTIDGTDRIEAVHFLSRRPGIWHMLTDTSPPLLERYRDVKLTTGDLERQLEAVRKVDYGP